MSHQSPPPPAKPVTAPDIAAAKGSRKLAMLTAYDYPTAAALDGSGVDMLLVGDSLAMVVLGHEDTLSVTMDEMLHHVKAVRRGASRALVVGDMPFGSYQAGVEQAVNNCARMLSEGGARAVKMEGGGILPQVEAVCRAGIPVMGHIGLTPQHMAMLGGFKLQGRTADAAKRLRDEALQLEAAGCFSIVLEVVPSEVAAFVTEALRIPTIGIGAGPACDGQVLVIHDLLGLYDRFLPRFVRRYAGLGEAVREAVGRYVEDVREGRFPDAKESFALSAEELAALRELGAK